MRVYAGAGDAVAGVVAAFAAGADGVAAGVRRTADGELVCRRTPGTAGPGVTDLLDAARGRGPVLLDLGAAPGEPDFDAPEAAAARLLAGLLAQRSGDDVVVSSFDWFAIEAVRAALPAVPTAFLTPPGIALGAALSYVLDRGHAQLHPHASVALADPDGVAAVRRAGVEVVCWSVDDPADLERLAAIGVDGVVTGDPAALGLRRRP